MRSLRCYARSQCARFEHIIAPAKRLGAALAHASTSVQTMRWSPRGAHLLLQTRTRVLNGGVDQLIRRRYPAFRKPTGNDIAPL
jgi:hypothetical protein